MATAVYATIPSKIWLNLKAMDVDNTKIYNFLHPFLYLSSYSRWTLWIFGHHKPGPETALMTSVTSLRNIEYSITSSTSRYFEDWTMEGQMSDLWKWMFLCLDVIPKQMLNRELIGKSLNVNIKTQQPLHSRGNKTDFDTVLCDFSHWRQKCHASKFPVCRTPSLAASI